MIEKIRTHSPMSQQNTQPSLFKTLTLSLTLGVLVAFTILAGSSYFSSEKSTTDNSELSSTALSFFQPGELQALIGDGDYQFFPNRRNMWVVNKNNGRVVHYKFVDVSQGKVERSHVAQINRTLFPAGDTVYKISERNISDFLWVCNEKTGDFQLWRRSVRDGRLVTDPNVVSASQPLLRPALPGNIKTN